MTFGGGLDIYYFTITWCVQGIGKWESDSLILFPTDKLPMQIHLYMYHGEIVLEVSKIKD